MNPQSSIALWKEGFRWGLESVRLRPEVRMHGLRQLACPVDLWRYREFKAVLSAYGGQPRVLDLGSPKLLARILSQRFRAHVTAIGMAPSPELSALRSSPLHPVYPCLADGRLLPFPDASFDFVFSVSAIEHVGGEEGDTQFAEELARVMTPGAAAVITTPLVPAYRELWFNHGTHGRQLRDAPGAAFFSRFYDWSSVQRRIVRPCGLRLVAVSAWQERRPGWYAAYCARTASPRSLRSLSVKALDPFWAHRMIVPVPRGPEALSSHGLVALVLRKE